MELSEVWLTEVDVSEEVSEFGNDQVLFSGEFLIVESEQEAVILGSNFPCRNFSGDLPADLDRPQLLPAVCEPEEDDLRDDTDLGITLHESPKQCLFVALIYCPARVVKKFNSLHFDAK
ncbi:hypothetical protein Ddye_028662 [Dipteronia dyeriana]|uniref:Uncharacterized protein n=1 Tax=Dipteronia dyeriana TaxID=168575 RepID=A0AAD9WKW9_9ROSI|nr:hypothetical protein Ddye_028662 [Dipteronia dyeriana]